MTAPGQFDGKVALVTGAGSGIGRASALAFAFPGFVALMNRLGARIRSPNQDP